MKRVLILGGAGHIGAEISFQLASEGYRVGICYKGNEARADALVQSISEKGQSAEKFFVDILSEESIVSTINSFTEGGQEALDGLVNSAGMNFPTDFEQIERLDWDKVVGVNLTGAFLVTKLALPALRLSICPAIVHIGSISGQIGGPRTAHYAASKAGLFALSHLVARYGAPDGIRCNVVSPGYIESEMAQIGAQSPEVQEIISRIPLKRLGQAVDVAHAVSFLISPKSGYITGQTLNVNGGLLLS